MATCETKGEKKFKELFEAAGIKAEKIKSKKRDGNKTQRPDFLLIKNDMPVAICEVKDIEDSNDMPVAICEVKDIEDSEDYSDQTKPGRLLQPYKMPNPVNKILTKIHEAAGQVKAYDPEHEYIRILALYCLRWDYDGNDLFNALCGYVKYSSGIKVVRKRGEADFRNEQNKDSCQFDIFMFYNVFLDEINTIYNVSRFKLVKLKELTKGGNTMEMKFYRCRHCGNIIAYVKNSGVAVVCCGEKMQELVANTVEASYEKHIPVVKVEGDRVEVRVGSIDHPMIPEHYIEWIALQTKQGNQRKALNPGDEPAVCFAICPGDEVEAVYEYCNLHGLWKA